MNIFQHSPRHFPEPQCHAVISPNKHTGDAQNFTAISSHRAPLPRLSFFRHAGQLMTRMKKKGIHSHRYHSLKYMHLEAFHVTLHVLNSMLSPLQIPVCHHHQPTYITVETFIANVTMVTPLVTTRSGCHPARHIVTLSLPPPHAISNIRTRIYIAYRLSESLRLQ